MDSQRERQSVLALQAYVRGESSEPVVLSAFRGVALKERASLVRSHRAELEAIDACRLAILESVLLPLEDRAR